VHFPSLPQAAAGYFAAAVRAKSFKHFNGKTTGQPFSSAAARNSFARFEIYISSGN
jgi:hypothetical protein